MKKITPHLKPCSEPGANGRGGRTGGAVREWSAMEEPRVDVEKELDRVVGQAYDPLRAKGALRRRLLKWALGAVAALAVPAAIIAVIESHRLPPDPPRKPPVPVTIVPGR